MKKYYIVGSIILLAGLLVNYKFGGFDQLNLELVEVVDYNVYGAAFEGSYKSNGLSTLVGEMRTHQKEVVTESNVVIINYIDEAKETLGVVSNFVGISGVNNSFDSIETLEKRTIRANKAIRIKVKIKPLVMPSPEKMKALAFDFAKSNGLELQNLSVEQYSKEGMLVVDFPVKLKNPDLSYIQKLANAYGLAHFDDSKTYHYTFNVKKGNAGVSRTWVWQPSSGMVTLITTGDTTIFNHKKIVKGQEQLDHTFINDKYWLLFPFQLIWDTGHTYTLAKGVESPIAKDVSTKLTVAYNNEDGYTPGDAYDFYINNDLEIMEWSFRKGGQEDSSLTTTWGDYRIYNGIKIATNHYSENGLFRLWFTDIKIE